jgi:WD40 repeat protein
VHSASFSPDGKRIVTAGEDRTVRVWDAQTGTELLTLERHVGAAFSASFSPDGTRIVIASRGNAAKVWDSRPFHESRSLDKKTATSSPAK